jgi:hypothetical protein
VTPAFATVPLSGLSPAPGRIEHSFGEPGTRCTTGTCVEACPMYGVCHCGCGQVTSRMKWNSADRGYVSGKHHRYIWGHFRPPLSPGFDASKAVPYSDVAGMVQALWDELGLYGTADRIGVSRRCASMWHNGHMRWVQRKTAAKIEHAYRTLDWELRQIQVPVEPLRHYFALHDLSPTYVYPKGSYAIRQFYRPTTSYLSADEMAVAAGMHPSEIWPDWWEYAA